MSQTSVPMAKAALPMKWVPLASPPRPLVRRTRPPTCLPGLTRSRASRVRKLAIPPITPAPPMAELAPLSMTTSLSSSGST